MAMNYDLGFIGAGNMTEGIVGGVLKQKLVSPGMIIVSDPVELRRKLFLEQFGTAVTEDNRQLVTESRCLIIAVKPQMFDEVFAPLASLITKDHLMVSIMAGIGAKRIAAVVSGCKARVVRVMPNLPIRAGAGMAGVVAGEHASPDDVTYVCNLFNAGGQSVVLNDESLIDAVTAVAGSGPAYFYYMVEAMTAGGVEAGLAPQDALKLAENTCLGAARMMLETQEEPAELRRKVCSKGGTTLAAIEHMERTGVGENIKQAVLAAARRSKELGK